MIAETPRTLLRLLAEDDAPFIVELLNDPDFLRFIGDKGVRTLDDAKAYVRNGPMASYATYGFGLFLVIRKADRMPIGFCGLIQRDYLPVPDIGYAFLPGHRGCGFAVESGTAVLDYGRREHGLSRVMAMTHPENVGSVRVLERLGLSFERRFQHETDPHEVLLFAREL